MRERVVRRVFSAYTSEPAARARRALGRLRSVARPRLTYFHEVGEPYSELVAQRIGSLVARRGVSLRVCLVGPPSDGAVPDRARLEAYARIDAARLAQFHGLRFLDAGPISSGTIEAAARYIAGGADTVTRLARIDRVRDNLLRDRQGEIEALVGARASVAQLREEQASAARRRAIAGHYLGGVVDDGGEVYWGIDRLDHLDRALGGSPREPQGPSPLTSSPDAPVDVFFSFRSPYSYLAIERIRRGPRPSRFRLLPVLPMVMRGLAVPRQKRMYIIRDTAREARQHDIPFGFGVDPLGAGIERAIAVFYAAAERGHGLEVAASCFRATFAEGVDLATDAGLRYAVERVGLEWAAARAALGDESWRATVEDNRQALLGHGLWGVPSFVRGTEALWGQDRLRWLDPKL